MICEGLHGAGAGRPTEGVVRGGAARRLVLRKAAMLAVATGLGACIGVPHSLGDLQRWLMLQPVVLLGEVHDNAAQHALRLAAFDGLLASGARPALVMEQLDREHQAAIDRLRGEGADATRIVAALGGPGWHWPFYQPFIHRALVHGLPLVAANVSRDDARRVMREGLAPLGFEPSVPSDVLVRTARIIEDSHCGLLDSAMAQRMALAQVARDQFMARSLAQHAQRGAVLLAGNGHVRTDVGVPRWMAPALRGRSVAIGVVEEGDATDAFDRRVVTAAQPRPDPCEGMRRR